ncbi:MAG: flagellin [Butyrivibrio sp.]|nr:flagellin [Acetatifactor muris]MCM1558046.1 flagellin [Butyrivibrio sp.]
MQKGAIIMKITPVGNTHSVYNVARSNNNTNSIYGKLASGKRINRAADDAAGLAIAQKILKENKGLDVGASNIRDGISVANVADGAMGTMTDSLQRIKELSIQASNGLYSDSDRKMIQGEVNQLLQDVQRTAVGTRFNEMSLLDGSKADMHIAANADGTGLKLGMENVTLKALGINGYDVTKDFNLSDIDAAIEMVSAARGRTGAVTNSLEHAYNSNRVTSENLTASGSRIEDLDISKAVSEKQKNKLLQDYSMGMMRKKMQDDASVLKLFGM